MVTCHSTKEISVTRLFPRITYRYSNKDHACADLGTRRAVPVDGRVENWNPRIVAVYDRFPIPHDILGSSQGEIVSPRFGQMLDKMVGDQIQLLPLRLISPDGKVECEGFSMLNVLHSIPSCDLPLQPATPLIFRATWGCHLRVSEDILMQAKNQGIDGFVVRYED